MKNFLILGLAATLMMACASAPPPVNGDWDIVLSAAEGSTGFPITIEADGSEAMATGGNSEFSGTWNGDLLTLSGDFYVPEAGYSAELNMDIRMDGERLSGTATWDQFQADVSGSRVE